MFTSDFQLKLCSSSWHQYISDYLNRTWFSSLLMPLPNLYNLSEFQLEFLDAATNHPCFPGFQAFAVICFQKYLFHEVLFRGLIVINNHWFSVLFFALTASLSLNPVMMLWGGWSQQVFCNCWKIAETIFSVFFSHCGEPPPASAFDYSKHVELKSWPSSK